MLTDLIPLLRALTVTVGHFHAYLERCCEVLDPSTAGQCPLSTAPSTQRDQTGTDLDAIGHGL
jgi:hypothetical protein